MFDPTKLVTYINGEIIPHPEAIGLMQEKDMQSSGGFYDNERTFNGKIFKLEQHLQRMFNGLQYSNIDPGISQDEIAKITLDVLESNLPLLQPGDDYLVTQVVSVGNSPSSNSPDINIVIYCQPIDFIPFARSYTTGVRIVTPSTYGIIQNKEADASEESAPQQVYPLMTGQDGSITECRGGNFMFVSEGRIKLPDRRNVLPGVSMQTVIELANNIGVPIDEGDYSIYDVYKCDEAFVSSTRNCMLPVATINGLYIGGKVPGSVTSNLLESWRDMVGLDFIQQAIDHLPRSDHNSLPIGD